MKVKSSAVTAKSLIDMESKAVKPNKFKSAAAVAAQSAIDLYALGRSGKTAVTAKSSPAVVLLRQCLKLQSALRTRANLEVVVHKQSA